MGLIRLDAWLNRIAVDTNTGTLVLAAVDPQGQLERITELHLSRGVSSLGSVLAHGELVVGDTRGGESKTLREEHRSLPNVKGIWLGAPTAAHAVGEANTGLILVGVTSDTAHTALRIGSIPLEEDNFTGFTLFLSDLSDLRFGGLNAGDVVEYMIFGG